MARVGDRCLAQKAWYAFQLQMQELRWAVELLVRTLVWSDESEAGNAYLNMIPSPKSDLFVKSCERTRRFNFKLREAISTTWKISTSKMHAKSKGPSIHQLGKKVNENRLGRQQLDP